MCAGIELMSRFWPKMNSLDGFFYVYVFIGGYYCRSALNMCSQFVLYIIVKSDTMFKVAL